MKHEDFVGTYKCEECGSSKMVVTDSRPVHPNEVRRRRKCLDCGYRMTYKEIPLKEYKRLRKGCDAIVPDLDVLRQVVKDLESVVGDGK